MFEPIFYHNLLWVKGGKCMVLTFYYFLGNEKYPGKYVLLCLDCLGILFTNMIWNVCAWECFLFLWKKSIRNTFIICETQIIRKPQRRAQYKRRKHQLLFVRLTRSMRRNYENFCHFQHHNHHQHLTTIISKQSSSW